MEGSLSFLVNLVNEVPCVADKAVYELYQFLHNGKVAALAGLVEGRLALLVLPLGVPTVLEEAPEDQQVPGLGRDVDRSAAVPHGEVWVSARLEQDLGALVSTGLVNPGRDMEWSLLLFWRIKQLTQFTYGCKISPPPLM